MDLGKRICLLRKKHHITQEQLAKAVGVSTPAVSKWETGASMPDILLLAPIARKLHTTLDELLDFREELSEEETKTLIETMRVTAREKGLAAAMEHGKRLVLQYPGADQLKLYVGTFPTMMAHTADEEYWSDEARYQKLLDETTGMLEDLIGSEDLDVRMAALVSTATRYMERGRFDEAEDLLGQLPQQPVDSRHLLPSLYLMKGEQEKMLEYTERNLLQDVQNIMGDLRGRHAVFLKEREYDKALRCAGDYAELVRRLGPPVLCPSELLTDTYLAMGDEEEAARCFLDYLEELLEVHSDYGQTLYYSTIAGKIVSAGYDTCLDIKRSLYRHITFCERYQSLLKRPEIAGRLEQLNAQTEQKP